MVLLMSSIIQYSLFNLVGLDDYEIDTYFRGSYRGIIVILYIFHLSCYYNFIQ